MEQPLFMSAGIIFHIGKFSLAGLESQRYHFPYWKMKEADMDRNQALAALDSVNQTRARLADVSSWPLWRHALFGLAEAVFIFSLSLPLWGTLAGIAVAIAITAWVMYDDKRRYGMFVSGWQGTKPRILLLALIVFVMGMAFLAFSARSEQAPALTPMLAAVATFAACTLASLAWQHLYRAELRQGAHR